MDNIYNQISKINEKTTKLEFWQILHTIIDSYEEKIDPHFRRSNGIYFTHLTLAEAMVEEIFEKSLNNKVNTIDNLKFLEPCVGLGSFVFSYLKKISELNLTNINYKKLISNIYICDINLETLSIYKQLFVKFTKIFFDISISEHDLEKQIANGLLFNLNEDNPKYISIQEAFGTINKFDIIITNPPYKNLKVESNKYSSVEIANIDQVKYKNISNYIKNNFKYSKDGVLNLYKIFVEEIICKYTGEGIVSLLIPSTILTDKSCSELRNLILNENNLLSVKCIKESNNYIKAQQAICTLLIEKNKKTQSFNLITNYSTKNTEQYIVKLDDLLSLGLGNSIFPLSEKEFKNLSLLSKYPKIKNLNFINNMRGELDVTLNKSSINSQKNSYPLVRGKHISYYTLDTNGINEYVDQDFIDKCSKRKFIENERIACQQIANINKERRVSFVYMPKNYVLGNSCNFMSVSPNDNNFDLFALLGIMNSKLINWLFKLTSSNNHINNYELDLLPIPINSKEIKEISNLVKDYLKKEDLSILAQIDNLVLQAYGIEFENQNIKKKVMEKE